MSYYYISPATRYLLSTVRAEVVGNLYKRFRTDHLLKKWSLSLIDSACCSYVKDKIDCRNLLVAKKNLEMYLKTYPQDHQARWNLGWANYRLLNCQHGPRYPDTIAKDYIDASLECFKQAQAQAPGGYNDSSWMNMMSDILNCHAKNPSLPRVAKRDAMRKEYGGMTTACERASYDTEILKGDPKNLKWGADECAAYEARARYRCVKPFKKVIKEKPDQRKLKQTSPFGTAQAQPERLYI